jgi:NADPH-dependent 2,4-dienoyl-CoA reductase/sulfur reductase-like enzyme
MRVVVIGAVAAGTSAAAKMRRNDESAEIVVYERDRFISYSGCGMPYYIGGAVESAQALTPRDSAFFKSRYDVDVFIRHEVLAVSPDEKRVTVKNLETGAVFVDRYDALVIATGARAVVPGIPGADGGRVFTLRNIGDMLRIRAFIDANRPRSAAIIGAGFIGLEMLENLRALGMDVSLIERLPQVMPGLDPDMAAHVQNYLEEKGAALYLGAAVQEIAEADVLLSGGRRVPADLVILSAGVRPNAELAAAAGAQLGVAGAIRVNVKMQTSLPGIYACGDCIEQFHRVTGAKVYRPLGSTANKTGRIAGDSVTGGDLEFRASSARGSSGLRFDRGADRLERARGPRRWFRPSRVPQHQAQPAGVPARQGNGHQGRGGPGLRQAARRADSLGTRAWTSGSTCSRRRSASRPRRATCSPGPRLRAAIFHHEGPVMYTGMILENAIHRDRPLMTSGELDQLMASGEKYALIDARRRSSMSGATSKPPSASPRAPQVRRRGAGPGRGCRHLLQQRDHRQRAQNILLGRGFKRVYNLSGGQRQYRAARPKPR